jgi:hypothetical protein
MLPGASPSLRGWRDKVIPGDYLDARWEFTNRLGLLEAYSRAECRSVLKARKKHLSRIVNHRGILVDLEYVLLI